MRPTPLASRQLTLDWSRSELDTVRPHGNTLQQATADAQASQPASTCAGNEQSHVEPATGGKSERTLEALTHQLSGWLGPCQVHLHENRRTMMSYQRRATHTSEQPKHVLRLHAAFLDATDEVLRALTLSLTRPNKIARRTLSDFIATIQVKAGAPAKLTPRGQHHNLERLSASVWAQTQLLARASANGHPTNFATLPAIGWGVLGGHQRGQRSIRLGSYAANEQTIRIHPVLDAVWVPEFFVAFVLFHELLHHALPAWKGSGTRAQVHHPLFRRVEASHPDYKSALAWEAAHMDRLLRELRKKRKELLSRHNPGL